MFLLELQPATLVYLTKLMDAPTTTVNGPDAMLHAQIRQQLAQPNETTKVVEQIKQQALQEQAAKNSGKEAK